VSLRSSALAWFALWFLLVPAEAAGDESPSVPRASRDDARRWDVSIRSGYGQVFTSGVSYLGFGWGAGIGFRPGGGAVRLEGLFLSSSGTTESARNDALRYRTSYSAARATLGLGYSLLVDRHLAVRPGLRAGLTVLDGRTTLGRSQSETDEAFPVAGLTMALSVPLGRLELGVDGDAYFAPTWVAAWTAGLYATAAATF